MRYEFPPGFVWGSATAAYQIEGAAGEDGRRPSIWDTFSRLPGKVHNGDTGEVACDHYHRVNADLDLMSALQLPAYRFSVSWARVLPDGSSRVNPAGLDFYSRLVDGLLARGISPLLTLYHWDLPQRLQDVGGWVKRDTVDRFTEYAVVVGHVLGDRVPTMTTLNEPFCSAFLGYGVGAHAPGITDNASALTAAHHLNLAHGRAVTALRGVLPADRQLSITLNLAQIEAASECEQDRTAAAHVDAIANQIFLEPILRARYPDRLIADTSHVTDWAFVQDGDLADISAPVDFLGVNYYFPSVVAAPSGALRDDANANADRRAWPGTDRAVTVAQPGPYTDMGWPIEPTGLTRLLTRLHRDYPDLPLVVTENGCACADHPSGDGQIHDPERIAYLSQHLVTVCEAIEAGVDIRGYYVWSMLDNFEWAFGYSKRFGIVYVDYDTLERTPKDSALWFREVIRSNALGSSD